MFCKLALFLAAFAFVSNVSFARSLKSTREVPFDHIEETHGVPHGRVSGPTAEELEQNKNAFYHFNSNIDDKINDQTQQRSETREGQAVKGSFSYSDGFLRRTVNYEADENGYRVVGEKVEPLEGPKINLEGTALVETLAHGHGLRYQVKSIPTDEKTPKIVAVNL